VSRRQLGSWQDFALKFRFAGHTPRSAEQAFSAFAAAQSYDCKLAKSPREHAVCSDKELGAIDSAVSAAYKSLRAQLSPESAALVQSDQREWLHWLDVICPAHGKGIGGDMNRCLANEYTNRERDLKQVAHIGSTSVFPRSHFLYKARTSNEESADDIDPGFGYGTLRWPQIDIPPVRPNPDYAEWNSAVKKKAAELALGIDPEDKNATFDTAVDASGRIDGFYTIEAANHRFIDVSLIDSDYGWGPPTRSQATRVSSGGSTAIASSPSPMSSPRTATGRTNSPSWPSAISAPSLTSKTCSATTSRR
jgi:uncharacterized protein YecT (DUF1311 family)